MHFKTLNDDKNKMETSVGDGAHLKSIHTVKNPNLTHFAPFFDLVLQGWGMETCDNLNILYLENKKTKKMWG